MNYKTLFSGCKPSLRRQVETELAGKNLLSSFQPRKGRLSRFPASADTWKICSDDWVGESKSRARIEAGRRAKLDESMAIIGRRDWSDLNLSVVFKFLTGTIKPPEGGAIVYFLFKNARNHMALHFCQGKNKIQLFKRTGGIWSMLKEQIFIFELNRNYEVGIRSSSGIHQCFIGCTPAIWARDHEIANGRIGIGGKLCDVEFSWVSLSAS